MDVKQGFLSADQTKKILGVTDTTLRSWAKSGKISFIRNGERSHRYYNVREYLETRNKTTSSGNATLPRRKICYCRVSTRNQKDDLERQISFVRERYPEYELIKDVGSGINFKRKGLKTILDYAIKGEVERVVVAYKDRLCRFGFDLIEWIVQEFSRGEIVVLNQVKCSPEQEVVGDVLSILNVFSARINGLRKYRTQIKEEISSTRKGNEEQEVEIVFED